MKKIKLKEKTMSGTICKEKCMSNIIRERGIVDLQQKNAITLIALIITIIVLLILAGVTLNMVMGDSGIIKKAQIAKEKTNASNEKEQKDLGDLESILEKYEGSTARNEYVSKIIKDFSPVIDYINGTYITVKVPDNVKNDAVGYAYLLNGKVKEYTKETEYTFINLELNQPYKISIIAMDEEGNTKQSEILSKTTLDKLYLYNTGNECKPVTGEWIYTGYHINARGTFEKLSDKIQVNAGPPWSRIYIGTKNKIDFTKFSKLKYELENNSVITGDVTDRSYYNNVEPLCMINFTNDFFDVSAINGEKYLHLSTANSGSFTINKIWLEE